MEFGAFAATALLIGQFGSAPLAAHQITLTCAAFTFMIPLGMSMAVTIRVGHAIGAKESARCRRIVIGAHASTFLIMGITALIFVTLGSEIASAFSDDSQVIAITIQLLMLAAAFQVFDGAQVISMGALRGIQDVNIPTGIVFVSFWVIGIPTGCVLAFQNAMSALGLWIGLTLGLAIASVVLTFRLFVKLSSIQRQDKDLTEVYS